MAKTMKAAIIEKPNVITIKQVAVPEIADNEVLIKVGVARDQRLGFVFRIADMDGKPFADISNE